MVLAIAGASAILALTLSPQPVVAAPFTPWCLVCGSLGLADVAANVLLFVPLGCGLALAGLSWGRATLLGLGLSLAVELSQLLAIPGRFPTLSDLLTNGTGTALAAAAATHRGRWARPRPRAAAMLAGLGGMLFGGALAVSAWLLSPIVDPGTWFVRVAAVPSEVIGGWFAGSVRSVTLDGVTTTHRGTGPVSVMAPARDTISAHAIVEGLDPRSTPVPMVYVRRPTPAGRPWLVIGQRGTEVVAEASLRARTFRLRRPTASVSRAAPAGGADHGPYRIDAALTRDDIRITVTEGATAGRARSVRIAPTLGWALVAGWPRAGSAAGMAVTLAWLAGLSIPLGYWCRWLARGGRGAALAAVVAASVAAVAGLAIVPRLAGFGVAEPREWLAALCGVAVGAATADVVRRVS